MKKIKFIFISFFVLVFTFSSCIICFADVDSVYTLKQLLTINGASVSAYRRDVNNNFVYSNVAWTNDSNLRISSTGSNSSGNTAYGFQVYSANPDTYPPLFELSGDELFLYRCNSYTYQFTGVSNLSSTPSNDSFLFKIIFKYVLNNGSTVDVTVFDRFASSVYRSGSTLVVYFNDIDYSFTVPPNYSGLASMTFEVLSSVPTTAGGQVTFNGSPTTLYVGDKSGAPIYNKVDDTNQNELDGQEEEIRNFSDSGFTEWNSTWSGFKSLLGPTSDFMRGTAFVTNNLLNPFINRTPLNQFLMISLVFGVFVFLLGSVGFVVGRLRSVNGDRVRARSSPKGGRK